MFVYRLLRLGPRGKAIRRAFPLAPDLLTYGWDATYEDIQANWREGLEGLVMHSDHGQRFGWHHPAFVVGDPDGPAPGHLVPMDNPESAYYPVVFSLNCDSGWFDNETDRLRFAWGLVPDSATGTEGESFCERVLRYPDGGAVAVVASEEASLVWIQAD